MLQPEWLTNMEDRFEHGDTDMMLRELNEDIQLSQDKSNFFKGGSSFVEDDNVHSFNQMFFDE